MSALDFLLNPTVLTFLGILLLVVALLIIYFEGKMREQNHKISSMLSLVSSLAEELNGVKIGFNHLAMGSHMQGGSIMQQNQPYFSNKNTEKSLIAVSDDEEDSEDDEEDSVNDDNTSKDDYESESESESDSDTDNKMMDIKVLKIDFNQNNETDENYDSEFLDLQILDELEDNEDQNDNENEYNENEELENEVVELNSSDKTLDNLTELLQAEVNNDFNGAEVLDISSSLDLKKININLEESLNPTDYKKLPLPKLRNIALQKGINTDTSKLKKNELLKLLGAE